jgi:hypothetical protein
MIFSSTTKTLLAAGAMIAAAGLRTGAQLQPFLQGGTAQPPLLPPPPQPSAPETNVVSTNSPTVPADEPLEALFGTEIPDAIAKGKFNLNVRARYENVDEDGVAAITKNSQAPTVHTRFGYTSDPLDGFQGMLEGVNVVTRQTFLLHCNTMIVILSVNGELPQRRVPHLGGTVLSHCSPKDVGRRTCPP